jgi:hypothetical protein
MQGLLSPVAVRQRGFGLSDDEVIVLLLSGSSTVFFAYRWYTRLKILADGPRGRELFVPLGFAPAVALAGIFVALKIASASDVRNAPEYLLLYVALGAAWSFASVSLMELAGISFRDDAVERHNPAATIALCAALFGNVIIYAGANIGEGPGWWCVAAAALIGSSAWLLLWLAIESAAFVSDTITIDRNIPAAIRLGGYMLGSGLICARGAAGDWTSLSQTFAEFASAWPAIPLAAVAIAVERLWGRAGRHNVPVALLIAALYVAGGVAAVEMAGPLPKNPAYHHGDRTP